MEGKIVEIPMGLDLVDAIDLYIRKVYKQCNYNDEFTAYCLDISVEELHGFTDDEFLEEDEKEDNDL